MKWENKQGIKNYKIIRYDNYSFVEQEVLTTLDDLMDNLKMVCGSAYKEDTIDILKLKRNGKWKLLKSKCFN